MHEEPKNSGWTCFFSTKHYTLKAYVSTAPYLYTSMYRKRRYLGRYFAHPMMQNRRAKRDDYKPSAVRVTQRYVP